MSFSPAIAYIARMISPANAAMNSFASVDDPATIPSVTPSMISGFPALPIPAILPFFTPISAWGLPINNPIRSKDKTTYLVYAAPIDDKDVRNDEIKDFCICAVRCLALTVAQDLSLMRSSQSQLPGAESCSPPPNLHSSPYTVKSFSTSTQSPISASLTRSPTVGPNIEAYYMLISPTHPPRMAKLATSLSISGTVPSCTDSCFV